MENLYSIDPQELQIKNLKETNLFNKIDIVETKETPLYTYVDENELKILKLNCNEDYTLNEDIVISKSDLWADLKVQKGIVKEIVKLKKLQHLNKCLAKELTTIDAVSTNDIFDLISNTGVNTDYVLALGSNDFKELLQLKDSTGKLYVTKANGKYYFNFIEILLIPDLTEIYLFNLSELKIKTTASFKEIMDSDTIRQGKVIYNISCFVGIGFLDPANIFKATI